jgi:cytochrome c-type biogenesis protein CcmF
MTFAHLSFSLLVIAATMASTWQIERNVVVKLGETIEFDKFSIRFDSLKMHKESNYIAAIASFVAKRDEKLLGSISPQLRFYPIENNKTSESDVHIEYFSDLYINFTEVIDKDTIVIKLLYKPFLTLIWLSVGLLGIAGSISYLRYRKNAICIT